MAADLQLNLGPVLFLWDAETWRDFYFRMADEAEVDSVTIGEVVCSKRAHFIAPHLDAVVDRLQRAGKTVKLASLALVTLTREERSVRNLADQSLEVEVNDLSALPALDGRQFTAGPLINVYNAATAAFLGTRGASTICLPPELPLASIREIATHTPDVRIEVFAFGRVPLALSARCAHARIKGNTKDNCQFVCGEDPDGLPVETLDHQPFLVLNGIQTMSHTYQTMIGDVDALMDAGVGALRLSPQKCDMVAVSSLHHKVLEGRISSTEALEKLRGICSGVPLSNGFLHGGAGADLIRAAETDVQS